MVSRSWRCEIKIQNIVCYNSNVCSLETVMKTRLFTLLLAIVILFVLTGLAPVPKQRSVEKASWPEILISKWQQVSIMRDGEDFSPRIVGVYTTEYTSDGKYIYQQSHPLIGMEEQRSTYYLEGAVILCPIRDADTEDTSAKTETWDATTRIESLTYDTLITVCIVKNRYTDKQVQYLSDRDHKPWEQIASEVRIEQWRDVWKRIQ